MCYGQTGAGKTFTMTGATENYQHRGILPRAISQLFKQIDERPDEKTMIWWVLSTCYRINLFSQTIGVILRARQLRQRHVQLRVQMSKS